MDDALEPIYLTHDPLGDDIITLQVYVEQFKLRKEQQRQHRLFALDMMEPPTRPHVVYPPGFGPLDVPGILGRKFVMFCYK